MAEQLSGQDGRQGKRGKPALYVLIVSVALMAAALAGLMTWQGANSPPDYASKSQDASRKQITGSENGTGGTTSPSNSSVVPGGNPSYPQPATRSANP
jgi:flagellar basal body-associated protein FliL